MDVKKVRVTVLKRMSPTDMFKKSPVTVVMKPFEQCPLFKDGQEFVTQGGRMPEGFPCTPAWNSVFLDARILSFGGNMPWFKEKGVSITCCPDGLRPVIFKVERIKD